MAGLQRLLPVILVTQEAEIRRIVGWSQPRQIVGGPYLKKTQCKNQGWWCRSRCRPWVQTQYRKKINK
jgi:hypothetical protein